MTQIKNSDAPKKLWGGVFTQPNHPLFISFNQSLSFDKRLIEEDIQGSKAYADELYLAGVIDSSDKDKILNGLDEVLEELSGNKDVFNQHIADEIEDIHSLVEVLLTQKIGTVAKKLHTGRSRNDQVVTDLKLWMMKACKASIHYIDNLKNALTSHGHLHREIKISGYTHLQKAQPISWQLFMDSYAQKLDRDKIAFERVFEDLKILPLGSGAIAGNPWPIDRQRLAKELGFADITANPVDAVSDRDYVLDFIYASSKVMLHLSSLCEDLIIYSTSEFNLINLSQQVTTGSSLMPQKRNPDALELIRGKSGRVIGNLQGLFITLKGLPSSYNKDLQEDKEALFESYDTLIDCLKIAQIAIEGMTLNKEVCRKASTSGYINATQFADEVVRLGFPFRDAHEITGKAVQLGLKLQKELHELSQAELASIDPAIREIDLRE